jgi:hypothetical protein
MVNVPQVQIPDFAASIMRGEQVQQSRLQALAQRQALDDSANARRVAAEELPRIGTLQGPELVSALGRLAGADPRYAQFAFPLIQRARDDAELGVGGAAPAATPVAMPGAGAAPAGIRTGAAIPVPAELDDADVLARTIIGEAGNQGEEGQRAVAAVIRNRMQQTGRGVRDVVLAPSQFEPWGARREELLRIPTTDPRYIAARRLAEETIAGRIEDPTRGATHFLNPDLQRQLGRNQPTWAPEGQGQRIGAHVFYAPGGGVRVGQPAGAPARDPNVMPASGGDTIPASGEMPRHSSGLVIPPGYDDARMARVAAANRASANNETAQRIMQQYRQDVQLGLATRRSETPRQPPALERLGDGPDGPAGMYERQPDGTRRRVSDLPPPSQQIVSDPGNTPRARADATTLTEMQQQAASARQLTAMFDRAERAVRAVPEGQGAQLLPIIGQTARALGIEISGTSEAEVLRSLTNGMAVLQRAPGSGATTDFEMRLFMQAVPRLGNTREGNLALIDMGRRLAARRMEEATIWRRHAGDPDIFDRINALPPVFTEQDQRFLSGDATPVNDGPQPPDRVIPPAPRTVPPGSAYSPSRRMWRSPDGRMFNENGQPAQ